MSELAAYFIGYLLGFGTALWIGLSQHALTEKDKDDGR